jgi:hypothetical protein
MSFGGRVASSSGCATRPKAREIGLTGCAVRTRHSLPIGRYVMATAEHREPCDSRGSCTVLGAPEGEIPAGDSTTAVFKRCLRHVRYYPNSGAKADLPGLRICAKLRHKQCSKISSQFVLPVPAKTSNRRNRPTVSGGPGRIQKLDCTLRANVGDCG